jgi:hypothetical protein
MAKIKVNVVNASMSSGWKSGKTDLVLSVEE